MEEVNPEFELFISKFNSQKIYITNYQSGKSEETRNQQNMANKVIYGKFHIQTHLRFNQILANAKVYLPKGEDAQIELIRNKEVFRLSVRKTIKENMKIRLFPDDRIIINSLPYRPETVVITGEIINPRLCKLSPSERKTLSALYSDQTFNIVTSDTSQIYLLRPRDKRMLLHFILMLLTLLD